MLYFKIHSTLIGDQMLVRTLICLNPYVHQLWAEGAFSLKPLSRSEDARAITVEWHWLPQIQHGPGDDVSLSVWPESTEGLDRSGQAYLCTCDGRFVYTGQHFTFTTTDPITMSLLSFTLLDMWFQLFSLSAATDERDDANIDDNDADDDDNERASPVPRRDIKSWLLNNNSDSSSSDEDTNLQYQAARDYFPGCFTLAFALFTFFFFCFYLLPSMVND